MVRGTFDGIVEGMATTIFVVVLAFGHRIVDIDGGNAQGTLAQHLPETMHPRCRFFRNTVNVFEQLRILLVQQAGQVAAIIKDHVRHPTIRSADGLLHAPPIFFFGLTLPGKYRDAGRCNRSRRLILRRKNVAGGPAHLRPQSHEGLDQDGGLDGHVDTASDAGALEWLLRPIFLADAQQGGHFRFGNAYLLAPPGGEGEVGNFVIGLILQHGIHRDSTPLKDERG